MGHDCGKLPEGIFLCATCRDELITDLERVESTVEAIWAAAARMNVGNGSVGSSGHSAPSEPTNSSASDTGRTLNIILTGWADTLGHREPHAVKAARVLLTNITEVREQEWAPDLKRELREVLWQCDTVTDRKTPRVFAGICPLENEDGVECGTPVYVVEGKTEAKCRECKATWDVTDWRGRALAAAGYNTGTAAEVSRMLSDPARNIALRQGTIRQWINRGKLTPIGYRQGRPVYQVRKVRNLWERSLNNQRKLAA